MSELGILTAKQEKWLTDFIISVAKFKGVKKYVAKLALSYGFKYLDDQLAEEKIKDELKLTIKTVLDYAIADDTEGLKNYVNSLVDIPALDEEDEANIINALIVLVLKKVKAEVNKVEITED